MKILCLKVLTGVISVSVSVSIMASGPRVTSALFESAHNEIVAVETPALYSSHSPNGGMVFEIVMAALSREKESATLTTYPVQKLVNYYLTQEKVLAGLGIHWSLSENENKNLVSIPVALVREQYYFYKPSHPNGFGEKVTLPNLKGLTYGAHVGEDTSAYQTAQIKVVYGQSLFLFKKLKTQKVDFIKVPILSANSIIDTHFANDSSQFGVINSAVQKSVCKIIFNLKNPEAVQISNKFRKGLSTILENGQYQAIIEKYKGKTPISTQMTEEFKTLWLKESQK